MFMDLDLLAETLAALKRAPFPPGTLHTFAIKANPVGRLLQILREAGLGAEVASLGELRQALCCGFAPGRVVFDSPIKTRAELAFALRAGVRLNLDNLEELERVARLVQDDPTLLDPPPPPAPPQPAVAAGAVAAAAADHPPTRLIGLRINPQVGEGSIAALSTAGRVSKFGIPLQECRAELLAAFRRHAWLNALHLHVGSQGVPLELTVEGVAAVAELAAEVEAEAAAATAATAAAAGHSPPARQRRVLALDIGGGLPVTYGTDDVAWLLGSTAADADPEATADPGVAAASGADASGTVSVFERYARLLQQRVPAIYPAGGSSNTGAGSCGGAASNSGLLLTPPQLVTEFGRCLVAKAAFAAGRVEYTKTCGGRRVVVSGLGGDLLLRAVYLPATWPVRVELCGRGGAPKLPAATAAPPPPCSSPTPSATATPSSTPAAEAGGQDGGGEGGAGGGCVAATDVVGPLCFQGDKLAEGAPLPAAAPGDWVVVPDVGAYTLSMYSRYNSRCSPPVWAYRRVGRAGRGEEEGRAGGAEGRAAGVEAEGGGGGSGGSGGRRLALPGDWAGQVRRGGAYEFVLLRRGENVEDVMAFWNRM
ncbi:hypothetical protein HXX76_007811 [Chlamydomonas incerta]|uniref:Diaminopimelate decarboxylase n=1 Tax=Chlamydomonas incerta TaxID=51695 RepID=A0A835W1S3_CHLIN|nr:hypothetical protein HXX76_007811 [Chlamydomonas incerta]|eukprot:KAG2434083.1 hypothetical protein HXX76_007811 [Chlamydomonas incerta]